MIRLINGPTFKELYPGVPEYRNCKPTRQFQHYMAACSRAADTARAFDAAPEVEPVEEETYEDYDSGAFEDLRKLAHSTRAHDHAALSDLESMEIAASATCGGWCGR